MANLTSLLDLIAEQHETIIQLRAQIKAMMEREKVKATEGEKK